MTPPPGSRLTSGRAAFRALGKTPGLFDALLRRAAGA